VSESKPVRFAILGVAQPHAAAYTETLLHMPETEVVAGYSWEPEAVRGTLPAALAEMPLYDDWRELLDKEQPEAILVCLPGKMVPEIVETAANRGIHIMAEKPCARTAAEWLPAQEAIERNGVQFATGYVRHFSPPAVMMRDLVQQGILGDLISAETSFLTSSVGSRNPDHWFFKREMNGGGILHWLGCHWIDLFRFVSGSEATAVNAMLDTRSGFPIDVEDFASVSIRYDNRMIATLHTGYVGANKIDIGFQGTLGHMSWDGGVSELKVHSEHPDWATAPTRTFRFQDDPKVPGYGGAVGVAVIRQFINAWRQGGEPAFVPDDVLRVLEVLDAAQQSSAEGRTVEVARA
jgi:predicted dehydrogenase